MEPIERARLLAEDIRNSMEYKTYRQYKDEVDENEGIKALLKEFSKMQMQIQLTAASGRQPDTDTMQRFTQLSALLYADPRTSGYLMAQIRLQKMTADIMQLITEASDLSIDLPGFTE